MSFAAAYDLKLNKLVTEYLSNQLSQVFFDYPPNYQGLESAVESRSFAQSDRKKLVSTIQSQYASSGIQISLEVKCNLNKLSKDALTICTGQQIYPLLSPAFLCYKITACIKLCLELSKNYPGKSFVPIFWMASEDHDKEEIGRWESYGTFFQWKTKQNGAVGRFHLEDFQEVLSGYLEKISIGSLKEIVEKAYAPQNTLSQATHILLNHIFQKWGLIILNPDDTTLKEMALPLFQKEIETQFSSKKSILTTQKLRKNGYPIQANPERSGLFYLESYARTKITAKENFFLVGEEKKKHTPKSLINLLHKFPNRFSPDVLLRPLYQEIILPNIAYIGGGAEIAYWLQLKENFATIGLKMPVLLLRPSIFLLEKKTWVKWKKIDIPISKIDTPLEKWEAAILSKNQIDLTSYENDLQRTFARLYKTVTNTDPGYGAAIMAVKKKHENLFRELKKKWRTYQRNKNNTVISQIQKIYAVLYPFGTPQERISSFLPFLAKHPRLIEELIEQTDPLKPKGFIKVVENDYPR